MADLPAHIKPLTGKALEDAKKRQAARMLGFKKGRKGFIAMPKGGCMGRK